MADIFPNLQLGGMFLFSFIVCSKISVRGNTVYFLIHIKLQMKLRPADLLILRLRLQF